MVNLAISYIIRIEDGKNYLNSESAIPIVKRERSRVWKREEERAFPISIQISGKLLQRTAYIAENNHLEKLKAFQIEVGKFIILQECRLYG